MERQPLPPRPLGAEALPAWLPPYPAHDRRALRSAVAAAVAVHAVLFAIHWPELAGSRPEPEGPHSPPIVVTRVRWDLLPPRPVERPRPLPGTVPIPVPGPQEPEIVRELAPEPTPDLLADADLGLPDAVPPPPPVPARPTGPLRYEVGGPITAPVRIAGAPPAYPRAAWAARLEGTVVLQLVIGADGTVRSVEVVKGLGMGCTQAAVRAVRTWRFAPATLDGRPVDVIYRLTLTFALE